MGDNHGAYLQTELIERWGRYPVRVALADQRLTRMWQRVLVDSDTALEVPTRAAAALLLHPPPSAIAGPTAAWLHGCDAADTSATHVLVPYGNASRSRDGLVVHNGPLASEDQTRVGGLRVLTEDRVISDLLCTARPRDALAVTDQMLATKPEDQREHFRAQVAWRLAKRSDRRGSRQAARLLELATGRAESPPESWLLLEVADLGFPPPEVNWPVDSPNGAPLYRLDLAWPGPRIALEYNGYAVHHGREAEDAARAADLRRRGWIVIFVTKEDLQDNSRLRRELLAAFERRGYQSSVC